MFVEIHLALLPADQAIEMEETRSKQVKYIKPGQTEGDRSEEKCIQMLGGIGDGVHLFHCRQNPSLGRRQLASALQTLVETSTCGF